MSDLKSFFPVACGVIVFAFCLCLGILAWNNPTVAPPGNNAAAPVNIGNTTQTKSGGLNVSGSVGIGTTGPRSQLDASGGGVFSQIAIGSSPFGSIGWPYESIQLPAWANLRLNFGTKQTAVFGNNGDVTIYGRSGLSRDNTGECCSGGDFTLSLAENTAGTGKKSGIQFHNGGISEGQLRLDNGVNGRELKAYSYQTDMDIHATGYVQGDQGLCVGNDCRSAWPIVNIPAATCPDGQVVTGITSQGQIICSPLDSFYWTPNPCATQLPTGGKRIFITSTTYWGNDVPNETVVDRYCQQAANAVGYSGIYKALVYMGGRSPVSVLPSGNTFWNGAKAGQNGTSCLWNLIAINSGDFFTADGSGNYIEVPIKFNEQGLTTTGISVWTGFKATGNGNYVVTPNGTRNGFCSYYMTNSPSGDVYHSQCYFGLNTDRNVGWSGYEFHKVYPCATDGGCTSHGNSNCLNNSRALYCVEQ